MSKLSESLKNNKFSLIVSLPSIDLELAEAAVGAGADALVLEYLPEQEERITQIISRIKHPVGATYKRNVHLDEDDLARIAKLGFDFVDLSLEHYTSELAKIRSVAKILSLNNRFAYEDLVNINEMGVAAIDAAIVPTSEKGKDLAVGDLQNYISIVISAGVPVIVPTQRKIRPSEVAILADAGAKAILLTQNVLGTTPKHLAKSVQEFRIAIDDLA